MSTRSEALFDVYCERLAYDSQPIPSGSELGRTPDRIVITPVGKLVVEIKELTPNEEDLRQIRELAERHWTTGGGTPGARAASQIKAAAPQLKSLSHLGLPSSLVLFDNIVVDGRRPRAGCIHLEPSFIDFGMYGLQAVHLQLDPADGHVVSSTDGRGGRRQITQDIRRYVSAVAVLYEAPEPHVYVYHNCFANIPLSLAALRGPLDRHFEKPTHPDASPQQWREVAAPANARPEPDE
jgi:hypothetical protein